MIAPKLRFNSFVEDWKLCSLKDVVTFEGGGTPLKSNRAYWTNGTIPWVSSQEVGNKSLTSTTYKITEKAVQETSTRLVPQNTILLVARSGILVKSFPVSVTSCPMAINQDIKALRIKDVKVTTEFLYQWIKSKEDLILKKVVKGGTTVQSVNMRDLEDLQISLPEQDEQEKIACFFSLLDRKIERQQEKIEQLEMFKKGIVKKLLSQELRFQDESGREFPQWEEVKLSDVAVSIDYGLNAAAVEFDGENKYIRITDIDDRYRNYVEENKVSPSGEFTDDYLVQVGDILLARTGASTGKSYLYNECDGRMYFAGFLIRVRVSPSVDHRFVYLQTLTEEYNRWVKMMSMRSGQPGINATEYATFSFKLPSKDEQEKISSLILLVDEKLQKQLEKLKLLTKFKQGMMDQMFV